MAVNNRELLELAAKAIRREVARVEDYGLFFADHDRDEYSWNPLTDDGDALRLAVKLRIDIHNGSQWIETIFDRRTESVAVIVEYFKTEEHRLEATRRAIVRAAAELGKAMNNG